MSARIKITKKDVGERFERFNEAYFEGKLRTPKFFTFSSSTTYGICIWYPHHPSKNKIGVARNVEWNEVGLDETIIHEMIHLYLYTYHPEYPGLRCLDFGHGMLFRREKRRLKEQYNLKIDSQHLKFLNLKRLFKVSNKHLDRIVGWIEYNMLRYIL